MDTLKEKASSCQDSRTDVRYQYLEWLRKDLLTHLFLWMLSDVGEKAKMEDCQYLFFWNINIFSFSLNFHDLFVYYESK